MTREYYSWKEVPEELRDDRDIVKTVIMNYGFDRFIDIPSVFHDDKEIVMTAAEYQSVLPYCSERFRDDKEVVLAAITLCPEDISFASKRLRDDKEVALKDVARNGRMLGWFSERLRDDKEVVLAAIGNNPNGICYASERLNNDDDIIWEAIKCVIDRHIKTGDYVLHLNRLPEKTWENKDMALYIIKNADNYLFDREKYPSPYCYLPKRLRDDEEVILAALTCCGTVLKIVPEKYKNNELFVTAAIENDAEAIFYASERLHKDCKLLRLALSMAKNQRKREKEVYKNFQPNDIKANLAIYYKSEIIVRIMEELEELNEN